MRATLWWLLRALLYYMLFEALAPFVIMFGGGWPRIGEGAVFAVVMASLHPAVRRRLAERRRARSGRSRRA